MTNLLCSITILALLWSLSAVAVTQAFARSKARLARVELYHNWQITDASKGAEWVFEVGEERFRP